MIDAPPGRPATFTNATRRHNVRGVSAPIGDIERFGDVQERLRHLRAQRRIGHILGLTEIHVLNARLDAAPVILERRRPAQSGAIGLSGPCVARSGSILLASCWGSCPRARFHCPRKQERAPKWHQVEQFCFRVSARTVVPERARTPASNLPTSTHERIPAVGLFVPGRGGLSPYLAYRDSEQHTPKMMPAWYGGPVPPAR